MPSLILSGQGSLTIEGRTYTNSDATWLGVNIPRSQPSTFIFRNNLVTSSNTLGYMLLAGEESSNANDHHLDGSVITGNKFIWLGNDMQSITHAIFTGHNSNVVVKYNYMQHTPMAIIRKSTNNMSNTGGGIAYNIVKGGAVGIVVKGMSNVNIFNNTLYQDRTTSQTWRPLIHIYTNTDDNGYSVAHGTKIYNNIFYTKYQTFCITLDDNESLKGLKCDYNIYWCETGDPRFMVNGSVKTFAQWQAMGFDAHSHVINPHFTNLENFAPAARLDFGMDLGSEWKQGLSLNSKWELVDPLLTEQTGTWQVGAVLHGEPGVVNPPSGNNILISPNPAHNYISISNLDSAAVVQKAVIYDLAGRLRYESVLFPGINTGLYINLEPGLYIFQILAGNKSKFAKKLIIIE